MSDQEITTPTSERLQRAHRILDATAALVLRWGYNKTTIDDIARQAGVGKGTVYLHWKTREELFRALMKREQLAMGTELRQRIANDPIGATLHGIFKHTAHALMKHPLLKAFLLRDINVLGKLAQSEQAYKDYTARLAGFTAYLEFLRAHALVRSDLSVQSQVYTLSAIFMGFFLVAPLMPNELALPEETLADLVGDAVQRALGSDRPIDPAELYTLSRTFLDFMNRALSSAEEQFQRELES